MTGGHDPEALEQYLEGALRGEAKRRVEAHLEGCPECAEQVRVARRIRGALAEGRDLGRLSRDELAELGRRVQRDIAVPPAAATLVAARWRWPAWAAVGAAAAVALWVSRPGEGPGAVVRPAERAPKAATAGALNRAEAGVVAAAVAESASLFQDLARGLAPTVVANLGTPEGMAQVIVGGAPGPAFAAGSRGGRRALVLSGLGGPAAPARVEIPVPARAGPAEAVSTWVWADGAAVDVSLEVTNVQGLVREGSPRRRVAPGQWMLVAFDLPADAAGSSLMKLCLVVTGAETGPVQSGGFSVAIDRVEVWRHAR